MLPSFFFPISLGANSSSVMPFPYPSKMTIKSFPDFSVRIGLQPLPKLTSVEAPKRRVEISISVCGSNSGSALISRRISFVWGVIGFLSSNVIRTPGFNGRQMFLELCRSLGLSSFFKVSITAKFAWIARPCSS